MRVALVHDELTHMGAAERVLLALHVLFPDAPVYTSLYDSTAVDRRFAEMDLRISFLQRIPLARRCHHWLLPLYLYAFDTLDLRRFDLVISNSSAFAKGIVTRPDALHICYCHAPMDLAWSFEDFAEQERLGHLSRWLLRPLACRLRLWDYAVAARVDYFIANSPATAARIAKYYRRESSIIPPPVDTDRLLPDFLSRFQQFVEARVATHPTLAQRAGPDQVEPHPALANQFDTLPLLDQPTLPRTPLVGSAADVRE
jgi:glycosyltransferase involved in cell wall biosynthesis